MSDNVQVSILAFCGVHAHIVTKVSDPAQVACNMWLSAMYTNRGS